MEAKESKLSKPDVSVPVHKKVLIGSSAVNYYNKNILQREAQDKDYLVDENVSKESDEDHVNGTGIMDKYHFSSPIASLDEIYTLKVSHSPWIIDGNHKIWNKHLKDIYLLQQNGASLIPELHSVAYKKWEQSKGKKNVNLNQDKEEFFTSGVKRIYDHDSIHAAVAFNDDPMYMKILADNQDVKTSSKKFDDLSHEEKKQLVHEETMVLSLERDLIPMDQSGKEITKMAMYSSYSKQLRLLITQYSKGWFPRWIIENFFSVARPPLNYWSIFHSSDKKILL